VRTTSLSILHIDDDPLWCQAVRLTVESLPGGDDYRCGATGAEGIRLAQERAADLVLLDLRLPDHDGFWVANELVQRGGTSRIIVLSARSDDAALLQIMQQTTIAGVIWKTGEALARLPEAIAEVRDGRKYHPPEVRMALRRFRADPQAFFKILSNREIALLPRLGRGLTDEEIAAQTGLCALTVKSHRQHILAKLGLHRTPELIYWAIEHGFVAPPPGIGWVREEGREL
jgi:DNA-binding NarL/FixJ family response regulator